jgi:hypothetical protein
MKFILDPLEGPMRLFSLANLGISEQGFDGGVNLKLKAGG